MFNSRLPILLDKIESKHFLHPSHNCIQVLFMRTELEMREITIFHYLKDSWQPKLEQMLKVALEEPMQNTLEIIMENLL